MTGEHPTQTRAVEDYIPRTHWVQRCAWWLLAPLDSQKVGLSLTRVLAVAFCWGTIHLAHDWLSALDKIGKDGPGWAFGTFIIAGFALSTCTALGGKYVLAFLNSKLNPENQVER